MFFELVKKIKYFVPKKTLVNHFVCVSGERDRRIGVVFSSWISLEFGFRVRFLSGWHAVQCQRFYTSSSMVFQNAGEKREWSLK